MRRVWIWLLVDIPHPHDCDDHILLLDDEEVGDGSLDGVLHEGWAWSL